MQIARYSKNSINLKNESKKIHTSSSYEYEWLVTYGKKRVEHGYGITMDNLGNIYVTGLQDGGGPICFLKYNNNGTLLWNKTWGKGSGTDYGYGLVIDDLGYAYITGTTTATKIGNFADIFLLKYDLEKIPIETNLVIPSYNISFFIIGIGIIFVITLLIERDKIKLH